MRQMNIFEIFPQKSAESLESITEEDMVQRVKNATEIPFEYKDGLWGYQATIKKVQFNIQYSRYKTDGKRFISCGWQTKSSGCGSPVDSIDDAIKFFINAKERLGI